jgi:transcriptional regulator with XRE-family HTH domain
MQTTNQGRGPLAAAITANLRSIRMRKKLSQEKLGELAGVSWTYVSEIERGNRTPSIPIIEKLAKALGVPPQRLVTP